MANAEENGKILIFGNMTVENLIDKPKSFVEWEIL